MWRGRNTTEGERRRTTARSQYHEVKQIKRKANKQVILILVTERFTYGDGRQHICKLMRVRSQQRGQTISSLIFKFFCCVLLSGPSPVQPLIVHVDLFYLADGSFWDNAKRWTNNRENQTMHHSTRIVIFLCWLGSQVKHSSRQVLLGGRWPSKQHRMLWIPAWPAVPNVLSPRNRIMLLLLEALIFYQSSHAWYCRTGSGPRLL